VVLDGLHDVKIQGSLAQVLGRNKAMLGTHVPQRELNSAVVWRAAKVLARPLRS
jgi:hypothetical protein